MLGSIAAPMLAHIHAPTYVCRGVPVGQHSCWRWFQDSNESIGEGWPGLLLPAITNLGDALQSLLACDPVTSYAELRSMAVECAVRRSVGCGRALALAMFGVVGLCILKRAFRSATLLRAKRGGL
jgi:hypothetical protein